MKEAFDLPGLIVKKKRRLATLYGVAAGRPL